MIHVLRFLLALVLLPFGRGPAAGAYLIDERDWNLCQCALRPGHRGFCWTCFGMQAVPQGCGYDVLEVTSLSYEARRKVGDECVALYGYNRCGCYSAHGPNRLCEKCAGTGAVPPE